MNDDICTMLQRTNQIWCAEGVIDNKWDAVLVSYGCYTFQVEHVAVRVTEGLGIYYFRVGFDGGFQCFEVVDINNGVANALSSTDG